MDKKYAKEQLADDTYSTCPSSQAAPRCAGSRLDQMVTHQLLEAAIELAQSPSQPLSACRPRSRAAGRLCRLVRIEHHLLRLAWIGAHEPHAGSKDVCATFSVTAAPASRTCSWLQSNWSASPRRMSAERTPQRCARPLGSPTPERSAAPHRLPAYPRKPELPKYTLIRQPLALGRFALSANICSRLST